MELKELIKTIQEKHPEQEIKTRLEWSPVRDGQGHTIYYTFLGTSYWRVIKSSNGSIFSENYLGIEKDP